MYIIIKANELNHEIQSGISDFYFLLVLNKENACWFILMVDGFYIFMIIFLSILQCKKREVIAAKMGVKQESVTPASIVPQLEQVCCQ